MIPNYSRFHGWKKKKNNNNISLDRNIAIKVKIGRWKRKKKKKQRELVDRVPSRMKSSWIPAESVHPPEGNSRWGRGRVESFQEKFRTVSRPVIGI